MDKVTQLKAKFPEARDLAPTIVQMDERLLNASLLDAQSKGALYGYNEAVDFITGYIQGKADKTAVNKDHHKLNHLLQIIDKLTVPKS